MFFSPQYNDPFSVFGNRNQQNHSYYGAQRPPARCRNPFYDNEYVSSPQPQLGTIKCSRVGCRSLGQFCCPICDKQCLSGVKSRDECRKWCSQQCFDSTWSAHRREHEQEEEIEKKRQEPIETQSSASQTVVQPSQHDGQKMEEVSCAASDASMKCARQLTQDEAALVIQKWFRGYQIRLSGLLCHRRTLLGIRHDFKQLVANNKNEALNTSIETSKKLHVNGLPLELVSYQELLLQLIQRADLVIAGGSNEKLRHIVRVERKEIVSIIQKELDETDQRKDELRKAQA